MPKREAVSREEFEQFIKSYPRPLERDVLRICEPEQIQYNDFALGNWPESVVASYDAWGHTPDNIWGPDPGGWTIRKEAASRYYAVRHNVRQFLDQFFGKKQSA